MQKTTWKIGEIANQTGITVRTLHHYHKMGLLVPSEFTKSGHRLYTNSDIAKLQQIISLKQMGLSLEKIHDFIENHNFNKILLVQAERENINEQIKAKEKLCSELDQLHSVLTNNQDIVNLYIFFYFFHIHTILISNQDISVYLLFKLMELIQMSGNTSLTQDQMDKMKNINDNFTDAQRAEMQSQWDNFILNVKNYNENQAPVTDTSIKMLDIYFKNAISSFTDDPLEKDKSTELFSEENPNNPLSFGLISEMYKYLLIAIEKL